MRDMFIQDSTLRMLGRGLDLSMARQKLLVDNVANAETPEYRRKDMEFLSLLLQEYEKEERKELSLQKTHSEHLTGTQERWGMKEFSQEESIVVRQDGSGVDIEREMTMVLENALYYQALTRMASGKLNGLSIAIREVK